MNPSFEEYWQCPTQSANLIDCKYVFNPLCPQNNNTNCFSTSDYFNECAGFFTAQNIPYAFPGFQNAKNGSAYIGYGINDYYREYVQIKLSQPLKKGSIYPFSFYVNLSNYSHITTNQNGVKFVNDSIIYNKYLWEFMEPDWVSNVYITDTADWTLLSGEYKAKGGEQWVIIGNFYPDTIYPFIEVQNPAPQGWKDYYYLYIDDFIVEKPKIFVPNVFTPNNDNINDIWLVNGEILSVEIYNRWGEKVFFANESFSGWDGRTISGIECSEGIYSYLVSLKTNDEIETHKGTLTLLR